MNDEWEVLPAFKYFESYFGNKVDLGIDSLPPSPAKPIEMLVERMLKSDYFWAGWVNNNPLSLFSRVEIEGFDVSPREKQFKVLFRSGLGHSSLRKNSNQAMLGLKEIPLQEQECLFDLLLKENVDALDRNMNASIESYFDLNNYSRVLILNAKLKEPCPSPGLDGVLVPPGLNNKDPLQAIHQFIRNVNQLTSFQISAISTSIGFNSFKQLFENNLIDSMLAPPIATPDNMDKMREMVTKIYQKQCFKHILPLYQRRCLNIDPVSTIPPERKVERKRLITDYDGSLGDMLEGFKKFKNE